MNRFISDDFEKLIYSNVVESVFPKLRNDHKDILHEYLIGSVQMLALCHNFYENKHDFIYKLKQNNYKDLRWFLTLLLPYMNQEIKKMSELTSFDELYALRFDAIDHDTRTEINRSGIDDINYVEPKYVFTNIQYNRVKRINESNEQYYESTKFDKTHIEHNYYLLLESIKTTRYKLHVNWIDIIPYRLDNFTESVLYKETVKKHIKGEYSEWDPKGHYQINKIRDDNAIAQLKDKISGLNIEDIYDTISLDLYEAMVPFKWLIYDVRVLKQGDDSHIMTLIYLLDILLFITPCYTNIKMIDLDTRELQKFKDRWDILVSVYENEKTVTDEEYIINDRAIEIVIKSLVVFFDKKYSKISSIIRKKKYVPLERLEDILIDEYDEEIMRSIGRSSVLNTLKSIDYHDAYDFIRESIEGLKTTWYGNNIILGGNLYLRPRNGMIEIEDGLYVSFKNIYNFCKSYVHERKINNRSKDRDTQTSYTRYPSRWISLNEDGKKECLDRLNRIADYKTWFNISRNIRFVRNEKLTSAEVDVITKKIYETMMGYIITIVFTTMIYKGILSKIVAENEFTDASMYDMTDKKQIKNLANKIAEKRFGGDNVYKENSYYYLTNDTYENTGKYKLKLADKIEEYDYFRLCTETRWFLSPSFHWVSQISFCHRFINTRINFVTGATGAGKSTQVPKMYLYFLKALDHVNDSTIIITIPRVVIATDISNYVSLELGVPYQDYNDDINTLKKNGQYYVQYRHMKDKYVDNGDYPKIRFVTDGSFLQDVKDPLLKKKRIVNDQQIYSLRNKDKYNVVIVDEAHEHNEKMDMILTMMKYAAYYNNKIRLVIMSATIESDEPIYRRYYRDINDNRKYPLNKWIEKHGLDRINVDRRYHISPPDVTTKFKIKELYKPSSNPVEIVQEILRTSESGDILIFQPGVSDINNTIKTLNANNVMPNDVIAIPYHAQLHEKKRTFVENIDKQLSDLKISKNDDFYLVDDLDVGSGIYTRVVLVATNVAEASITINTLKYVIDIGLEKTMHYDYEKGVNTLRKDYITEASRLQRKGRVGRTSDGTVYYLYPENHLVKNKKNFSISTKNLHIDILDYLRDSDDIPLFTDIVDRIVSGAIKNKLSIRDIKANIYDSYRKLLRKTRNIDIDSTDKYAITYKQFVESMIKIFTDQYVQNGELYTYRGNYDHYDYDKSERMSSIYLSGYDASQLIDNLGKFYIIHPDELYIQRNINGDVVKCDQYTVICKNIKNSKFKKCMVSNKMMAFWEILFNSGFIGIDENNKIISTKLGRLFKKFTSSAFLFNDDTLTKVLFFGYGLTTNDEEFEKILTIVAILERIKFDITKIMLTDPKRKIYPNKTIPIIKKLFGGIDYKSSHIRSDIDILMNIIKLFDNIIISNGKQVNTLKSDHYLTEYVKIVNTVDESDRLYDDIIKFNTYTYHKIFQQYSDIIGGIYINQDVIREIMDNREKIRISWNNLEIGNTDVYDVKQYNISELRVLMKEHRSYMKELNIDMIKATMLLSDPYKIAYKINNTQYSYINLYNPSPSRIMIPKSIGFTEYIMGTFVDNVYLQGYIMYSGENLETNEIYLLQNINKNDLLLLANVYNKQIMKSKLSKNISDKNMKKQYLEQQLSKLSNIYLKYNLMAEHITAVNGLEYTVEKIKPDIENITNDSKIWKIYERIGSGYENYSKILKSEYGCQKIDN